MDHPGEQATPRRVEVLSRERVFDGFFRIDHLRVRYERFDGAMTPPLDRLVFWRRDAAGLLPYDRERREVLLVQQFRLPAFVAQGDDGWLWEIIAGVQDEGRTLDEVARAEAEEEAGYRLGSLRRVMTFYPSPGGSSERLHLYLAPLAEMEHVGAGGGLAEHGEDVRVRRFPLDEALRMIEDGRIVDAKTIIALQYLAWHWNEL